MERISPERKSAALAKLLPPCDMTTTAVALTEGISEAKLPAITGEIRLTGGEIGIWYRQNSRPLPGWLFLSKPRRSVTRCFYIRAAMLRTAQVQNGKCE
ncbi:hypothetical protein [Dickeya undicola]|uniref:hypothetical protein n=1 Tax=Dickeya undicola TaxID=1577887 RepID=UPI00067CBAF1|nr:hypothetical protein [Dickeya undicola]